jgi:hypothetical protein
MGRGVRYLVLLCTATVALTSGLASILTEHNPDYAVYFLSDHCQTSASRDRV